MSWAEVDVIKNDITELIKEQNPYYWFTTVKTTGTTTSTNPTFEVTGPAEIHEFDIVLGNTTGGARLSFQLTIDDNTQSFTSISRTGQWFYGVGVSYHLAYCPYYRGSSLSVGCYSFGSIGRGNVSLGNAGVKPTFHTDPTNLPSYGFIALPEPIKVNNIFRITTSCAEPIVIDAYYRTL